MTAIRSRSFFFSLSTVLKHTIHKKFTPLSYDAFTLMKQFFEELKIGFEVAFAGMFGWMLMLSLIVWFLWSLLFM